MSEISGIENEFHGVIVGRITEGLKAMAAREYLSSPPMQVFPQATKDRHPTNRLKIWTPSGNCLITIDWEGKR